MERWLPIAGHPGYEVSDHGRVRSLERTITQPSRYGGFITRRMRGRLLLGSAVKSGHRFVSLGRHNYHYVHILVLTAFVGPCPDGHECCHWDDDPANNYLSNLRWGTRADNIADFTRNKGYHQAWPERRPRCWPESRRQRHA